MATNRLDLGRVRGDDGANGQPAVVEVLEETATSYVLGITYYDDEGVEHVIQTPNLKGTDGGATFTVGSDADLQKWMNAEAGNDYTYVLVKPATYTLSGSVDLAAAGTEAVMGFGASLPQVELRGSGSEMVIGLAARAYTDVLLVAADGSVRCSNLRGELLTASAADALAAPATAANYGRVRYGQAGTDDSELTGVTPAKLRAGIRAPYNPSSPDLNVIYVQGDGDDYVLSDSTKISASGFNVPSAIKRVLASGSSSDLKLHILTTDGRLFYASQSGNSLSFVELVYGLPTEPIKDIAYNPDTDWTSNAPLPAMLTATKFYKSPTQSSNYGGTECYYVGDDDGSQAMYLVRHENEKIGRFVDFDYYGPISSTALPADAKLYPAKHALLIKASSYVKVVKLLGGPWSDYADDDPASPLYAPQVRFSPDVFPDGFSASALFDDGIVGRSLGQVYNPTAVSSHEVLLFMTAPRVLNGKLMSLVMMQDDYHTESSDFYAKLVVWEGYEDYDSAAGAVLLLRVDDATQSVYGLLCAVFKDGKTYQTAPAITGFTYKETSEHKVGIGFVEKQEVDGVMEYKAGDGAVFLTKEGVEVAIKTASVSEVIAHNSGCNRWLRFDPTNRKGLVIKGGTSVSAMINGVKVSHTFEQDTAFDLTSGLAGYNISYGRTFVVYLTDIGGQSPTMRIALPSEEAPADGVLLGWFSTLCADYGQNYGALVPVPMNTYNPGLYCMVKPYSEDTDPDFARLYRRPIYAMFTGTGHPAVINALVSHPLALYKAGDILPESIWCRDFHPACVTTKGNYFSGCPDAMVFDVATGRAVDVYGMHRISSLIDGVMHQTSSQYCDANGKSYVPLYSIPYDACKVSMLTVGKDLMTRADFYSASMGSPQHAALTSIPNEVGGYSVTNDLQEHPGASGRLVSFIGCEHMCGALEQWLDGEEHGTLTRQGTINNDIDASFGIIRGITERILKTAGGTATAPGASWVDSSGSLALQVYSSDALPNFVTGRGVCRVISGTRGQA